MHRDVRETKIEHRTSRVLHACCMEHLGLFGKARKSAVFFRNAFAARLDEKKAARRRQKCPFYKDF
jgi:hypothetical protein